MPCWKEAPCPIPSGAQTARAAVTSPLLYIYSVCVCICVCSTGRAYIRPSSFASVMAHTEGARQRKKETRQLEHGWEKTGAHTHTAEQSVVAGGKTGGAGRLGPPQQLATDRNNRMGVQEAKRFFPRGHQQVASFFLFSFFLFFRLSTQSIRKAIKISIYVGAWLSRRLTTPPGEKYEKGDVISLCCVLRAHARFF